MKTIAVLNADLDQTPLGTRSRLAEPLAGTAVLRRTVERLQRCRRIAQVVVAFPQPQAARVEALLAGSRAVPRSRAEVVPPYRSLIRAARKWSLDAWRGGLGGSNSFDEYTDVGLCAALAAEYQADAVASVPPGAALLDPELADEMIDHAERRADEVRMTFAQAPPGLVPTIFQTVLCRQMADSNIPPGWTLAYKPDDPAMDLAFKPCCFAVSEPVRHASGRLTADTNRSVRTLQDLIDAGADGSAELVGRWLLERETARTDALPREVEIELTTDDAVPNSPLRPRARHVPSRGPIKLDHVARIARELSAEDDALVVLGGHGDPVLHPQFGSVLKCLRDGGIYGIAVYTTGQRLGDEALDALIVNRVDATVFMIDAWAPGTYARLTGGAELANVMETIERLMRARQEARQPEPVIVPQFTKCTENIEELDAFFDGWMRAQGCATVLGYSHYGGRLPDLGVVDMTPPTRFGCLRVRSRCMVLADGNVVPCDQDYTGQMSLGHLDGQTLSQIWTGTRADRLRRNHVAERFDAEPLCGRCAEWHRP